MRERELIKLYKRNRGLKNQEEAQEKIDIFWNTLFKAIEEKGKVIFKGWGTFKIKEVKSRKIIIPGRGAINYTQPKNKIKFKAGKSLVKHLEEVL